MFQTIGLQNRWIRSTLSLVVAFLLIGTVSYLGVHTYKASHASSGISIYASPDSTTLVSGTTVSITIRENSGSIPVNSVQMSLSYDRNALQYLSIAEGGQFPIVAATSTSTPGLVRVARAKAGAGVSGDQPIVTLNFKVISTSGNASIAFDRSSSLLVRSSDNKDILESVGSGSFTIAPSATMPIPVGSTSSGDKPVFYVNPATGSYPPGSSVSAAVHINSHSSAITTVEATISYPTIQLQYEGVTEGGVFTTKQRTNASNGVIDIIRSVSGGDSGLTGDNLVVTLLFKVIGSSRTVPLSFTNTSAAYDSSGTGKNILDLAGSVGASYALSTTAVAPPPSSSSPKGGSSTIITSPAQALIIESKSRDGRVAITTGPDKAVLTELAGEVNLAPITNPEIFARNPNDSVKSVEYYLDGRLISTQKTSPFTYKFNTNSLRNGTYSMVVKTKYSSGAVDSRTEKLLVSNKITLSYVIHHFIGSIIALIAILVALVVVMWKLVIPRFAFGHNSDKEPQPADQNGLYGLADESTITNPRELVANDPLVVAPSEESSAKQDMGPNMSISNGSPTVDSFKLPSSAMNISALPMNDVSVVNNPAPLASGSITNPQLSSSPNAPKTLTDAPIASSPAAIRSTADVIPKPQVAPKTYVAAPERHIFASDPVPPVKISGPSTSSIPVVDHDTSVNRPELHTSVAQQVTPQPAYVQPIPTSPTTDLLLGDESDPKIAPFTKRFQS